jgi:hypothetical protein
LKKTSAHLPGARIPTVFVVGLVSVMRELVVTQTQFAVRLLDGASPVLQTSLPTGKRCGIDFTARLLSTPMTFQVVGSTVMIAAAEAGAAGISARQSASRVRHKTVLVALRGETIEVVPCMSARDA